MGVYFKPCISVNLRLMDQFSIPLQVRWADLDPNYHVRHSVYYDWGAQCRISWLTAYQLDDVHLRNLHVGPILFREECIFRREIRQQDELTISLQLLKAKPDFSRWTIQHQILKKDNVVAAVLTCDGAWIDTERRKLTAPPELAIACFTAMPRHPEFQWLG